jgi:hypothetical protein
LRSRLVIDTDQPDADERAFTSEEIEVAAQSAVLVLGIQELPS